MKKKDLLKIVAESAGITESQAEKALDAFYRFIEKRLKMTWRVTVPGFGAFIIEEKNGSRTVNFLANKKLMDRINKTDE